jgi:peptidyl-dipeptidase A
MEVKPMDINWQAKAETFLNEYLADLAGIELKRNTGEWQAENSGRKEDFDALALAELEFKQLHGPGRRFAQLQELLAHKDQLNPLRSRSLRAAELEFKENQLPETMLQKLTGAETEVKQVFNTFRGQLEGKPYTNNDLLEMLKKETDTLKRQKIWEALKQVGEAVAVKLVTLAKVRNEAAKMLGYDDFWDMRIRLQEHLPDQLISIFNELEQLTDAPFRQMKAKLDAELAERFNIQVEEVMPWHYDNPFFQAAPPSDKVDLDAFYKEKKKEEIIELAKQFYADIGLPIEDIVERSDLYEREGKNQHAFCTDINRSGDVRVLENIKPTAEWMDTTLHEMGHGVYFKFVDFSLPYNLRDAAHIFTTEAIAMLFGALGKNPTWMKDYADADAGRVKEVEGAILEQRRREQLIFARWTLVMFHFEKALYQDPDQYLNTLWWDMKERFQHLKRPRGRDAQQCADWAAKPHFTIAPVYYHNYMLGELFASQLRATLVKLAKHQGPASTLKYGEHKEFGTFFKEKIFRPGMTHPWPEFIKNAVGESLTAAYFAAELR